MTKKEKIACLSEAMTTSKRDSDEESFYHFTDKAPRKLKDLFLQQYDVQNLDYETFSHACDIVSEIYADKPNATDDEVTEDIYERSHDSASVYTSTRLSYLNNQNESDISELVKETSYNSIASACAIWYDKQVEQQAIIIKDWVNA